MRGNDDLTQLYIAIILRSIKERSFNLSTSLKTKAISEEFFKNSLTIVYFIPKDILLV